MFRNSEISCYLLQFFDLRSFGNIYVQFEYLLRVFMGDVLDGHAASGAVDEDCALFLSVESHAQIKFLINRNLLNYVHTVTRETGIARLFSYECSVAHLGSHVLHLLRSLDDMDTALEPVLLEVSEPAAAPQDLRFYYIPVHGFLLAELFGNQEGFLSVVGHVSERDRHAEPVQQLAGLVLVEFQAAQGQVFADDERTIEGHAL